MNKFIPILDRPLVANSHFNTTSIIDLAKNRWGNNIITNNAELPFKDHGLFVFKPKTRGMMTIDGKMFLRDNGFLFPNFAGLIIFEELFKEISTIQHSHFFILGLDDNHNLKFKKGFGHVIPCLEINNGDTYYNWFPQETILEQDEFIFGFKKF